MAWRISGFSVTGIVYYKKLFVAVFPCHECCYMEIDLLLGCHSLAAGQAFFVDLVVEGPGEDSSEVINLRNLSKA